MNLSKGSVSNTPPSRLNVIGAGKLGRTLARLFSDAGLVTIGAIYNRNSEHSHSAQAFIGAGRVITNLGQLSNAPAQFWMVATPDDAIGDCAKQLAALAGISWQKTTVFHSSGLKTSAELSALQKLGSSIASAHPAHSFASPERSLTSFVSTVCTLEGDEQAINTLDSLFSAIGGQTTTIEPEAKPLYHAATVMASNYLIALLGASEALLEKAGIEESLASAILSPLMRQSLENGLTERAINALTGPIARGDIKTLQTHLNAIEQQAPDLRSIYTALGAQALKLVLQKNTLHEKELAAMEKLLFDE
jgi:predicted short-subunit dehydrogenase-like oxidoreductase (DUF2520 family)